MGRKTQSGFRRVEPKGTKDGGWELGLGHPTEREEEEKPREEQPQRKGRKSKRREEHDPWGAEAEGPGELGSLEEGSLASLGALPRGEEV